jgi:ubiquinone/menaquinone biosynthesis C-methylase UbiE
MDYDKTDIASTYDLGRDHGPEVLNLWMNVVASYLKDQQIKTILDLGCGTGRFSEALAAHFEAQVIGIDPSEKMLAQAQNKRRDKRVSYELGSGESIPLPDQSVDLIFISMIFHHLDDPALATNECRRVLRRNGTVFLRAGVRDRISRYPYVDFFPATRAILEDTLPSRQFIRETFEAAGFFPGRAEVVTQEISRDYAAYADKLATGADSVLASLLPGDLAAGLNALRDYAASHEPRPVTEPIDVFVFVSK